MDIQTLKTYVGKRHEANLTGLLASCENVDLSDLKFKDPKLTQILSVVLGIAGIDRLYQGGVKMMLTKWAMLLLSFGCWFIVDIYYARHAVEQDNYNKLLQAIG